MSKKELKPKRQVSLVVAYQTTFNNVHGQKVIHDLMVKHHVTESTASQDPYEMALLEGERRVVLRILKILKTNAADLNRRIDEALAETQEE